MDFKRFTFSIASVAFTLLLSLCTSGTADAQIRAKKPDRGVYQSPVIDRQQSQPTRNRNAANQGVQNHGVQNHGVQNRVATSSNTTSSNTTSSSNNSIQQATYQVPTYQEGGVLRELADSKVQFQAAPSSAVRQRSSVRRGTVHSGTGHRRAGHQGAGHQGTVHAAGGEIIQGGTVLNQAHPINSGTIIDSAPLIDSAPNLNSAPIIDSGTVIESGSVIQESCGCPDCAGAIGCDAAGCDSIGCDSSSCDAIGCNSNCGGRCKLALPRDNAFISLNRCDWFGSIELLLMFRRGDRPPALVTTGPALDIDTAGELGQAGTEILVGGDSIFKDRTAGARLQIGTWLDQQQSRSLVLRGWFAGEQEFGFTATQDSLPVIARPFFNVSDGQVAEQDTQIIAFPDVANGELTINGDSNVFGGDLSIRQLLWGEGQFAVDVFYGYQFMRLDERLGIDTTAVSLSDDFAPLGSVLSVRDSFDIENEFHGGQIGLSSFGRHGCWSFSSLAKLGFGSLRRSANLQGQTSISNGGVTVVDNNGLLVRETNSGSSSDSTFGWVPELDFTLGWRRFPHFDVTIGYHVIALTDALQVSGAIDEGLAVNLADPPTGQLSPEASFRFDTFYVQGIHFGLSYIY